MKVKELIEILEEDGWREVRQRGNHRQSANPVKSGTVTVAGKPNVGMSPSTLNHILKRAGLEK